jgi:osmotically-inducible protein OsmY
MYETIPKGGKVMEMRRRDPEEIRADVSSQLFWDNRIDDSDIAVDVADGRVVLSGTVPSFSDRWEAEDDAWSIPGVRSVDNRLKVTPVISPALEDEQVKARVRNVLDWSPTVDASGINVSVSGGVVTLTGNVDSSWQRTRAWDLASGVSGVVDVINELTVSPPQLISDEDIRNDILSTLARNTLIDASRVNVGVDDGIVTLTGSVDDYNAFRTVYQVANYTTGVIDVNNDLTIV